MPNKLVSFRRYRESSYIANTLRDIKNVRHVGQRSFGLNAQPAPIPQQ